MDEWLTRTRDAIASAAGIPPAQLELQKHDIALLLDLAGLAAHDSGQRTNAPLLCYLLGKAERGASLDELAAAIRENG